MRGRCAPEQRRRCPCLLPRSKGRQPSCSCRRTFRESRLIKLRRLRCSVDVDPYAIREREQQDRAPYRQWVKRGSLTLTPGNATDLVTRLSENHGLTMVEFRQGYLSLSDASRTFERLVFSGRIRHGENPILQRRSPADFTKQVT